MEFYIRRLPHWHPPGVDFFVTWRLHGSLPANRAPGASFLTLDERLDFAATGPRWLTNGQVALCVSRTLQFGADKWGLYELKAWVVMPNHVHVLLRPNLPLRKALMNVKSASARAANAILERTGKPFWQDESYDHWVRNDRERGSIVGYIHNNPVSAGLVEDPKDWPWSSACS